ncbi:MAG: ABC transporter substrate-binding protein, partial [Spirochaetia bacterium]|nr:ABC transporter substrate-binding protein [Spirochaetia bacterium]
MKKFQFLISFALFFFFLSGIYGSTEKNIYTGIYLNDVSGFDLKEGRFQADFFIWAKWSENHVDLDVEKIPFNFANGEISLIEHVSTESDGPWKSVRWRIQGTFRSSFPLHKFPFDTQSLPIEIEIPPNAGSLMPDLTGSGMNQGFSITGWVYEPYFKAKARSKQYESDLGSVYIEGEKFSVDSVSFIVTLKRPFFAYIIKLFFPLAVIIAMAVIGLLIVPDDIEARAGMIITALLTCVALNLSLSDSIPDVPYTVVADKFFLGAYFIILLTLVHTIVMYKMNQKENPRVPEFDQKAQVLMPLLAVFVTLGISVSIFFTGPKELEFPELAVSTEEENRPVSAKNELTVNVISLKSLLSYDIADNFLARGIYHKTPDGPVPYVTGEIPAMTNEFVRFLPEGEMRVRWKLRPGMEWRDGRNISADDVAFSIEAYDDRYRKEVNIVDNLTVDVYYNKRIFSKLNSFRIIPAHELKSVYKEKKTDGITDALRTEDIPLNGPYKIESFEKGKKMVFVRNPEFRGRKPLIERVIFSNENKDKNGKKAKYAGEAILKGLYDVAPAVSSLSGGHAMGKKGLSVIKNPEKYFYYLKPGINKHPFNRIEARMAVAHAINRAKLKDLYDSMNGEVAHSFRSRSEKDFSQNAEIYQYSPEKSRSLLRSAGFDLPVKIIFHSKKLRKGSPQEKATHLIISNLNDAGFKVELKIVDSVIKAMSQGAHEGLGIAYTNDREPENFWNLPDVNDEYVTDKTYGAYDEDTMKLFNRYQTNMFAERSLLLSQKLQDKFSEKLPLIPLFHATRYTVYRSSL